MPHKNQILKIIISLFIGTILSACSIMDKSDYPKDISKKATSGKYISLPSNMKSSKIESYYPIPKLTPAQQSKPAKVSVVPPGSSLDKNKL